MDKCDTISEDKILDNSKNIKSLLKIIKKTFHLNISTKDTTSGTYGHIYFAKDTKTSKQYVIKVFKDDITSADVINEIAFLSLLNKYDMFPKIYRIVEINEGNNVAIIISNCGEHLVPKVLLQQNKLFVIIDFLTAYKILYDNQITHRDIKNNNVCIDFNDKTRIIDFGYARRGPFISSDMELIKVNKHLENFSKTYDHIHSSKVDLMSIFNMIAYVFNCFNNNSAYHYYPLDIYKDKHQIDNLVYLILCNKNTYTRRINIFNMFKNITGNTYYENFSAFNTKFENTLDNDRIYYQYRKIIKNIPPQIYKHAKKLLNINPKSRISFGKFFHLIQNEYKTLLPKKIEKNRFELSFNEKSYVSLNFPSTKYLIYKYKANHHPKLYSIAFYRFCISKPFVKIPPHELFEMLVYINYVSMVDNIEPDYIDAIFSANSLMSYIKFVDGNIHFDTPYTYLNKMRLFRWTQKNELLFDYFLMIFSTHEVFCLIHPYLLCCLITLIIYRINNKFLLDIDIKEENILLPCKNIEPIAITKNTKKILLENERILIILNKMYGYYAGLVYNNILINLDKYIVAFDPNLEYYLNFYKTQSAKFFKKNLEPL
ncbi:serine/threonine-protein kinase Nek1 [Tupanvirus soda lake]|uniref:Serine/threonine-protein kinase Nek1 n=2 Tax=Tupanvirus TaxID=2094720 RepID=A0A6N1NVX7_9VIRU|nr:serine/threonine-protein kinase Nek1 [Tupanvirus soda lake]QKU35566.1 serine/threonine-protein kinase Nek1 [Tupanvirus soda lake]